MFRPFWLSSSGFLSLAKPTLEIASLLQLQSIHQPAATGAKKVILLVVIYNYGIGKKPPGMDCIAMENYFDVAVAKLEYEEMDEM